MITLNPFDLEDVCLGPNAKRGDAATKTVLKILKDGEWHAREEVIREALHVIPPGKAWRQAESRYKASMVKTLQRQGMTREEAEKHLEDPANWRKSGRTSQDDAIRQGKRDLLVDVFHSNTRIEMRTDDRGTKWVRRVPASDSLVKSAAYEARMEIVEEVMRLIEESYDLVPKRKKS